MNIFTIAFAWLAGRLLRANDEPYLLSTHDFAHALGREQLRSDRTLTCFSLLTISGSAIKDPRCRVAIEQQIERRIRFTDSAGLLEEDVIGIVLPDTLNSDAWTLARDLQRLLITTNAHLDFDVLDYPSFVFSGDESSLRLTRTQSDVSDSNRSSQKALVANRSTPKQAWDDRSEAARP